MTTYGFPLVCTAIFLVAVPLALRALWLEYRRLARRHNQLLAETARIMEIASAESELARRTINMALKRLADIREKLDALTEAINSMENHPTKNHGA
jgi:hypothetical protein